MSKDRIIQALTEAVGPLSDISDSRSTAQQKKAYKLCVDVMVQLEAGGVLGNSSEFE